MSCFRRTTIPAALWLVLLGAGGCTDKAPAASQDAGMAAPTPAQDVDREEVMAHRQPVPLYVGPEWFVATGELDENNRYSSTVEVYDVQFGAQLKPEEIVRLCSGVVVSPRLVLTAASCLCRRREVAQGGVGRFLSDSSSCAMSATIRPLTYERRGPKRKLVTLFSDYDGAVTVHPSFRMVLDEQGNIISSEADLAAIELEEPVEVPAVELADVEVKIGDSLILVGHGFGEKAADERRFSTHSVTKTLASGGRIAFEQPRGYGYKGARGGPCLRATGKGTSLVAILGLPQGREASFTSVSPYRAWLREQISRAAEKANASPGHP